MLETLYQSTLKSLPLLARGKVRDVYEVGDEHLLMVTTDRLSAFDVVLPDPIPGKGAVLTAVSNFWFRQTQDIIPNHLTELTLADVLPDERERAEVEGRAIVTRKLRALPVEAIVRGYLIGSGWKDYQNSGSVSGIALPAGLQMADKLPEAIFTPSTKADAGDHDENIDFEKTRLLLGDALAQQVQDVSLKIYTSCAAYALQRGIIIADTKFEFGLDDSGQIYLIDEVLTPDSSRFWDVDEYQVGISPPSFDKQILRDYLETLDWDKTAPGPEVPSEIKSRLAKRYAQIMDRLMGS